MLRIGDSRGCPQRTGAIAVRRSASSMAALPSGSGCASTISGSCALRRQQRAQSPPIRCASCSMSIMSAVDGSPTCVPMRLLSMVRTERPLSCGPNDRHGEFGWCNDRSLVSGPNVGIWSGTDVHRASMCAIDDISVECGLDTRFTKSTTKAYFSFAPKRCLTGERLLHCVQLPYRKTQQPF